MQPPESEDDLTVVLLPAGPVGDEVLDLARAWTSAGLLRDACWTTTDRADLAPPVPDVRVRLLHAGSAPEDEEVDLFALLARRRRRLVRCLVVQPLLSAAAPDPALAGVGSALFDRIAAQLPISREAGASAGTRLVKLSMVVPVSGVDSVDPAVFCPGADAQLVVAPEDRRGPLHPADFVRPSERFPGHVLLHVAVVGGLVAGVPSGAFDDKAVGPVDDSSFVTVLQAWGRSVLGERTTDALADDVVTDVLRRDELPPGAEHAFVVTDRPEALVQDAADELAAVEQGALTYTPVPVTGPPPRWQGTWGQALASLRDFTRSALGMWLRWLVLGVQRRAESSMTSLTYGSRGAAQVRLRPAVGHELLRASAAELDRSVAAAHEQVRRGSTAETGATTPQLWSALRAASLGLLDGETSPLAPRRCGQRREVVLEPARVVPAPDSRHVVGAHAAELLELDDGDRALAGWDARGVAAVESRWALLTATGTSGADDEADLARALAEELEQLRAQREVWARSLAWRVAARLGAAADRAVRDRDEALRTLASPTGVDVEAVDRERRHFLWGTSAVVAFVLVVTSGHLGALDWRDHPRVGVALLLGTLLVEGLLVRRYYQEHSALERALALRLHVVRTATTTASHAGREARRLSASYAELMQWAALLAHVVHRPWQLPPRAERPADPDLDASRLPLALAVARSEEAERGPGRRQRAAATAVVLRPGYLRHAFLGLVARALPDQDRDVAESVQLLDQDSPGAGNGSRRRVLDALTEGAPQRELALEVRDRVARDAVPESADLAGGDVRPVVGPGEPALPCALSDLVGDLLGPAPAFAQALWSSHALVRRQQATGSSVLWAPDWYAAGAASGLEVRPAPGQAQRVVFAAVRCDASVPVPLEDLVLFAPRVAEPPLPVPDQPRGNAWV